MARRARVLIVEDEWVVAEDHAWQLRRAGYDIAGPIPDVAAALRLLDGAPIDVAILDVWLRGENSYALADRLNRGAIPFAFVSGLSAGDLPPHLRPHPMLSKPVLPDTLRAMVDMLLDETPTPGHEEP
ncbi:response regulator [Tistrella bauzanensis]|jgi:DNA-binding response OmpR family regulator|uniref:response regulator n=1 Tax=Tistrella TaxID=171436 RepID=UPI0031F5FAF3